MVITPVSYVCWLLSPHNFKSEGGLATFWNGSLASRSLRQSILLLPVQCLSRHVRIHCLVEIGARDDSIKYIVCLRLETRHMFDFGHRYVCEQCDC